jgi:hypothetical protein
MNHGSWYWPDVSDLDGAKDATKYGMWCAIIVAAVTAGLSVLTIMGMGIRGISAHALVDAFVFAGVAYGLSRYSRFAAVAGFVLYLAEKIYAYVVTGSILGVGVLAVVVLFGLLNGVRGAFAYQELLAAAHPQAAPPTVAPGPL